MPSNFRSTATSTRYLGRASVIGIEGIDTRALVRRLRVRGAMNGVLSTTDLDDASLVAQGPQASPSMVGRDLVQRGGAGEGVRVGRAASARSRSTSCRRGRPTQRVVALDYGMKWNILRCLAQVGCQVTVVPGTATADEVLAPQARRHLPLERPRRPGRGRLRDRHREEPARQEADLRHLPRPPAARPGAAAAKTFKLKFGHRGANQPVLNERPARSRSRRRTTASRSIRRRCRRTSSRRTST